MTKTIRIDGVIGTGEGEISSSMIREQLPQNGTDPIAVKIHSEGGSVFEGFAMHDAFAAYQGPKSLSIESSAFSIASFIACAFDDVEISSNGYMMLHNPYAAVEGDDEDFARQSEMLGKLKTSMVSAYAQRSGKSEDEIKAILKNETYLNAQQSVEMGLAKRIAGQPVIGRAFAKVKTMPHGVVAALFGAGSDGENRETEGKPMSTAPVAATIQEIKAAYPKAKSDFIVKCLERALPMASVASAAAEEMMSENEDLKKQVSAMTEELAKYKAAELEVSTEDDSEEEPVPADAKAMDGEEDPMKAKAKAKAKGVKPVAKARTSGPSASARWNQAIELCLPKCNGNKMKAAALADRNNPGLRQAFVDEFNAK
jgi:ATP-dependent protease ClpP protease subunit